MLSFRQLSEKKTKIKINPKKDEIVEGQKKKKDDSYLETNMKKRQANNEKARKDLMKGPQMKNPHFESTEENAYVSQEEVSEEGYQEIEAETETDLTESFSTKTGKSSSALPGSLGAKAGTTYASKKDFKQAYRSNPGAFKSPLPGGMGSYMSSVKPSARNAFTSQRPSMGMPVGLQKSMFNSSLGKKLGGGGNFMKAAMKANNVTIDKKAGKSAGGKVKKEEVDISLLTFDQYQHAKTLDEEQLNEFLGKLFGGGSKKPSGKPSASSAPPAKPANPLQGVLTGAGSSQGSRSMMGRAGQAGAPMSKPPISNSATTGRPSSKQAFKPLEKIKKEEVEPVNEFNLGSLFGGGKKPANANGAAKPSLSDRAVGAMQNSARQGGMGQPLQRMMSRNDATAAAIAAMRGRSKGGKVPAKVKKEHHIRSFGSFLNERTRYAKETGKDFTTGNPSEKGGEGRSEVGKHMQKVMRPTGGAMSSRKKAIQPQGKKKEKGKKGPKGVTPVDKIKNQLARKRAPKKDPYGYGQGRYQGD